MSRFSGGKAPALSDRRREEVRRVNRLLDQSSSFSFLRLGDGELRFLLKVQNNEWSDSDFTNEDVDPSCENAIGTLGLRSKDYERLVSSFVDCDYLDTYDYQEYNQKHLSQLNLPRESSYSPPSSATAGIIPDWLWFKFKDYVDTHRCLFVGAEAQIQKELLKDERYRKQFQRFWPENPNAWFELPPNQGKNPSLHLGETKDIVKYHVDENNIDTVFMSLGGAAKILCYELACQEELRTIDWGSMLRSLTYSGSDGQATWRSSHHIYLERVPLEVYYPALRRAHPDLPESHMAAKVHAQMCLDLQKKRLIELVPSDVHEPDSFAPTTENLKAFNESYRYYKKSVRTSWSKEYTEEIVSEFDYWLLKKGIGVRGKIFNFFVEVKSMLHKAKSIFFD